MWWTQIVYVFIKCCELKLTCSLHEQKRYTKGKIKPSFYLKLGLGKSRVTGEE